jgi:hypothetical protein
MNRFVASCTQGTVEGLERFTECQGRCPQIPVILEYQLAAVSNQVVFKVDFSNGINEVDR